MNNEYDPVSEFLEGKDNSPDLGNEEFTDTCKQATKEKVISGLVIIGAIIVTIIGSMGFNLIKRRFTKPKNKETKEIVVPKAEEAKKTVEEALADAEQAVELAEQLAAAVADTGKEVENTESDKIVFMTDLNEAGRQRDEKLGNIEDRVRSKRKIHKKKWWMK